MITNKKSIIDRSPIILDSAARKQVLFNETVTPNSLSSREKHVGVRECCTRADALRATFASTRELFSLN